MSSSSTTSSPIPSVPTDEAAPPQLRELRALAREMQLARTVGEVLYWDDRAHRPVSAGAWRAEQRAWAAARRHELLVSDRARKVLAAAEDALGGDDPEVRAVRGDIEAAAKMPADFAGRFESAAARARHAWDEAREANDHDIFAPHLAEMCTLAREQAEHLGGGEGEPYDAVLGHWEPGVDSAFVEARFAELRAGLAPLMERRPAVRKAITLRPMHTDALHAIEHDTLEAVGFDTSSGRIVDSTRAFCIWLGPHDVRMTTRFYTTPWLKGLHSTLHESGHAIYAQSFGRLGVPDTLSQAPGLGIDESQSRTVENVIGRSRAFTEWLLGRLHEHAPDQYPEGAGELDRFYSELNSPETLVRRLGTDEITYNLHIELRFRMERAMVNGELDPADLPEAWNDLSEELLGARPERDIDGCLQDIHWSLGQWGYWPTYMLGNVYGTQLVAAAREALGGDRVDAEIRATGGSALLRGWLDDHVYRAGRMFQGRELVERVTGAPPTAQPLLAYLQEKFVDRAGEFVTE